MGVKIHITSQGKRKVLKRILKTQQMKYQQDGENYIIRILIIRVY